MGALCGKASSKVLPTTVEDAPPTLLSATPVQESKREQVIVASPPKGVTNGYSANTREPSQGLEGPSSPPKQSSAPPEASASDVNNPPQKTQEEESSDKGSQMAVQFVCSIKACESVQAYDPKKFGSGMKDLNIVPTEDSGTSEESDLDSLQASIQCSLRMADEAVARAEKESAANQFNAGILSADHTTVPNQIMKILGGIKAEETKNETKEEEDHVSQTVLHNLYAGISGIL